MDMPCTCMLHRNTLLIYFFSFHDNVKRRCFATDVWSAGCVLAELLLGQPIFPGDSGVDQLVEIIKVLGTPTREQIKEMNPNYTEFKFPQIKSHPWQKVRADCGSALSSAAKLLRTRCLF